MLKAPIRKLLIACTLSAFCAFAQAKALGYINLWENEVPAEAFGVLKHVNANAPKGGTLRLGGMGTFDNFNPFAPRGLSAAQMGLTYETLGTNIGSDISLMRGLLAESFDIADDKKSMKVILRKEAKFADGYPVTSEDVVMSFKKLTTEANPIYRNYYIEVEKAEAIDERTVKFTFKNSNNKELPLIVAQLVVLPAHFWKDKNLGEPQLEAMPGSGPYQLESYKMGSRVVVKKNPNWWGKDLDINKGRYNFERIQVDYYRDQTVSREAFFAGETDFFAERTIKDWMLAYDVPAVKEGKIIKADIHRDETFGMSGVFMNTRKGALANEDVRHALAILFDFDWVNHALFYDSYDRCESFFAGSTIFEAQDPMSTEEAELLKSLGADIAQYEKLPNYKATSQRAMMKESLKYFKKAGWNLVDGKMLNKAGQQLKLKLMMNSQSLQRVYSSWVKTLARMGVNLEMELVDQTQYVNRIRNYEFDMITSVIRQSENPGNEQRYFFGSKSADEKGSRNVSGVKNPLVDKLSEVIANAKTREELTTAVRVLDRVLRNHYYVVPGWYTNESHIAWWKSRIVRPEQNKFCKGGMDIHSWYSTEGK